MIKKIFFLYLIFWLLNIGTASASVTFDFSGTCEFDCSRFGLSDGEQFNEINVLGLYDGTDTSSGSNLLVTDIEYFTLFDIDFLLGNSFFDPVIFLDDNVLSGFILFEGSTAFCYDALSSNCSGGRFDTIVVTDLETNLEATGGLGHGPGQFTISSVPLPASIWLFSSGLIAFISFFKRKN